MDPDSKVIQELQKGQRRYSLDFVLHPLDRNRTVQSRILEFTARNDSEAEHVLYMALASANAAKALVEAE